MALPLDISALKINADNNNRVDTHDGSRAEQPPLENEDPGASAPEDDVDLLGPSVSPRDRLSYVADRREVRAIEHFDDIGQLRMLQRLLLLFRLEALKQRPDDIIDFGCEFFSPQNQAALRGILHEESQSTPYAGSALALTASPGRGGDTSGNNDRQSVSRALFE
jgi:hypothetical protein